MCTFIYSRDYLCDIGEHVFPVEKFRLIYERLRSEPEFEGARFIEPSPVTPEDLALVHTRQYIDDLLNYRATTRTVRSELPVSKEVIDAHLLAAGGTLSAARVALREGAAMNLNGGYHHCFPDHAEGFCYVNDVAITLRKMLSEGAINRAAIIDCDLHQGNGNAFIFRNEPRVFTFSIHQENNYPVKQKSDLDIGLADGTGDEEYLRLLRRHVPQILSDAKPDLVVYLAGADPYEGDQLGGLALTIGGLRERDEFVISECAARDIPVCILLAGGYAVDTADTVEIHMNTCRAMRKKVCRAGKNGGA